MLRVLPHWNDLTLLGQKACGEWLVRTGCHVQHRVFDPLSAKLKPLHRWLDVAMSAVNKTSYLAVFKTGAFCSSGVTSSGSCCSRCPDRTVLHSRSFSSLPYRRSLTVLLAVLTSQVCAWKTNESFELCRTSGTYQIEVFHQHPLQRQHFAHSSSLLQPWRTLPR